jgi:hypothetical protein
VGDNSTRPRGRAGGDPRSGGDEWLEDVARGASREVGDVPIELLGDYLPLIADAAATGRKPDTLELDAVGLLGRRAAELGVSAGSVVQLYLSAARRMWQQLPAVVRSRDSEGVRAAADAVFHVVDEAVARLVEAYTEARRQMVRWEENLRREFIEDLLRGDADVGRLVDRAEPFGLDMTRPHQVALAAPTDRLSESEATISSVERAVVHWAGDRDVLVATKDGWIVAITPADTDVPGRRTGPKTLGDLLLRELEHSRGRPWRVTVGRPYLGSYAVRPGPAGARAGRGRTPPRDPRRLLRCRQRHHGDGAQAAPVRPRRHLPPRPDQDPHRVRPR